jgi:hypothetical protein
VLAPVGRETIERGLVAIRRRALGIDPLATTGDAIPMIVVGVIVANGSEAVDGSTARSDCRPRP